MASDHLPPLDLRREDAIDLGNATDFHILLRAVDAAMPADAILYLEGSSVAPAVARFLRDHEAGVRREVVADSTAPAEAFHLPLADGNLARLRAIAEDHLRSEVASHLAVYRLEEMLLRAPDAGDGVVSVACSLPDETIERFRSELGPTLRRPKRRRWLFSRPRDD